MNFGQFFCRNIDNNKPAKPETKPANSTRPKTGDTSPIVLWMALLALSTGVTITTYKRKRQ